MAALAGKPHTGLVRKADALRGVDEMLALLRRQHPVHLIGKDAQFIKPYIRIAMSSYKYSDRSPLQTWKISAPSRGSTRGLCLAEMGSWLRGVDCCDGCVCACCGARLLPMLRRLPPARLCAQGCHSQQTVARVMS